MADIYDYDPTLDPMSADYSVPTTGEGVSMGDRGKVLGASALRIGQQLAGGTEAIADASGEHPAISAFADFFRKGFGEAARETDESLSPDAQQQMRASVTSPEFWDHPISASVLKALDMTPTVAASVAPALFAPAGIAATAALAGSGAVLGGAASASDVYDQLDQQSDDDLQAHVPYYAGLRSMGVPEETARHQTATKLMGIKPLLNAAATGAAMVMGPAGKMVGVGGDAAGAGLLRRTAGGFAEGAAGGAMMSGVAEDTRQQTQVQLDTRTQMSPEEIFAATAEGALIQGVMGGVGGAFHSAPGKVETVEAKAPDAAMTLALTGKEPVVTAPEPVQAPAPQLAPGALDRVQAMEGKAANVAADADKARAEQVMMAKQDQLNGRLPPEAPPVTPEVTPPPAAAAIDTPASGPVPEAPKTLFEQTKQLVDGQRKAMLYPKGTKGRLEVPEGMKVVNTPDGRFVYNPDLVKPGEIIQASKDKRLNEILDLGDYSKQDLAPRIAAGEPAVAVTERTPEGTEVKAAAGTTGTAPEQIRSLEATKTPGNTVQVEHPARVLADRTRQNVAEKPGLDDAAKQKIEDQLQTYRQMAEKMEAAGTPMKEGVEGFVAKKRDHLTKDALAALQTNEPTAKPVRARKTDKGEGKHYTAEQRAQRMVDTQRAAEVVARHEPSKIEEKFTDLGAQGGAGRGAIFARAQRMVADAEKAGVKIPRRIGDATDKSMEHSPAAVLLAEAKKLTRQRRGAPTAEEFSHFVAREKLLRSGEEIDRRMVLEDRRAEGERQKNARTGNKEVAAREAEADTEKMEAVPDGEGKVSEESEVEEAADEAPFTGAERPLVALKGDEVQGVRDRAGTFKVEKKRAIARKVESKLEAYDPGASSEPLHIQQKIERDLTGKSLPDVAAYIAKNAPRAADRFIAGAVQRLMARLIAAGHKFDFHIAREGDNVPSSIASGSRGVSEYFRTDNIPSTKVTIRSSSIGNSGVEYKTILHELIHAVTQGAIEIGRRRENSGPFRQFAKDLNSLRNALVQDFNSRAKNYKDGDMDALTPFQKAYYNGNTNALQNTHELLTWGLTDEHMQEWLETIPYEKTTMFDRFTSAVRQLLGLPINKQTGLTELLRISDRLFNHDVEFATRNAGAVWDAARPLTGSFASEMRAGNFTPEGNNAKTAEIQGLFRESFEDALGRSKDDAHQYVKDLVSPATQIQRAADLGRATGRTGQSVLTYFTTNLQYAQSRAVKALMPMAEKIFETVEKVGVEARRLKEHGVDLAAAMAKAEKLNPGRYEEFSKLLHEQTQLGVDASVPIGEGRNRHLALPKSVEEKLAKGVPMEDVAHEGAMSSWSARAAHPKLEARYKALIKADPDYAKLQEHVFKYYDEAQSDTAHGQADHILRAFDYKGTDAERSAFVQKFIDDNLTEADEKALAANIGEGGAKAFLNTEQLKVRKGPYAPLRRHGEHVVMGEYKVPEPKNGRKIDDDTYEFKTRDAAHDFETKSGLNAKTKIVYYDTATGKQVRSKDDARSTAGEPEQRFQIKLDRQHIEFHEREADARARVRELEESGELTKVGMEEKRNFDNENTGLGGRSTAALTRSLKTQKGFQDMSALEQETLLNTIREASLRAMSDNRVQSRRLTRRGVKGYSQDSVRNLFEYNNATSNFRARLKFQKEIDDGMKGMWDHVVKNRGSAENFERSKIANEVEKRVQAPDPNDYTGAYTSITRRMGTWSYIDRMARASHLILHQTHLPMITSPVMAGRHGLKSFAATIGAWKELTNFYGAGGHDAWAATVDSALHKGTDYGELAKKNLARAKDSKRLNQMIDDLSEAGYIHPSSGIEVEKYIPSRMSTGLVGSIDRGMNKVDTIFRHLTNSTEAVNRLAGSVAAYRLEFAKLTRAGKSEAEAHAAAVQYAKQIIHDTQGLYSSSNAAPIFKNKFLRPFLQFKQFPQMMYHLLTKLAVTALKGETREAKVQALASLGAVLGMHMMMAGVIQGTPLEAFKLLGLISKGIGLTEGDWSDVENEMRRSINHQFGEETGNLITHGLGAQLGVDVHHRLGMNSFVTFGMPDQLDSKSLWEFAGNAIVGAPGGLITDALKGTNRMLSGDIEGGAFQAAPLQALRDMRNAINPQPNKYGYEATGADRVKSILGFTPEAKAAAAEKKEAIYNSTKEYDTKRNDLIKKWTSAPPDQRDDIWDDIQSWNKSLPPSSRLNKGDLYRSLLQRGKPTTQVDNFRVNRFNKAIAEDISSLYP